MSKEQCITPRGDERCFDLKPDAKGFAYVLMWMDHLLEHDQDADPSYVLEWRVFVEACRSAMLSETVARQDIPEGRGSLPAGALERGSPLDAARGVNPGGAAPGGVSERCDDKKDDAWRSAALRLGEQLTTTGPNGYYSMTPTQWLDWCENSLPSATARQELPAEVFDGHAVFLEACSAAGPDPTLRSHHVSAVLDALARLMRKNAATDSGAKV